MTLDERAVLVKALGNLLPIVLLEISVYLLFFGFLTGLWVLYGLSMLNRGLGYSWARWAQLATLLMLS